MPSMLDAALSYLRRGWPVVPAHTGELGICSCRNIDCSDQGKHPRVGWKPYQQRLPAESQLREWWQRWPDANIAIITGTLVVVDVDPRHGGDESIVRWEPQLPDTPQVQTGGGGTHLYFAHPGVETRTVADVLPGVDIRATGGLVIAPPSTHSSGGTYEWDSGAHPDDMPLAPLPHFVAEASRNVSSGTPTVDRSISLDALMEGTQRVPSGLRNATMARLYGRLVHDADDSEAAAAMFNEQSFDPPLTEGELRKIIKSINGSESRKTAEADEVMETLDRGEPSEDGRMGMVNALWEQVGLPVTSDWFLLRGDVLEYLLVTPDTEVRLGENLLDYRLIRTAVFNQAGTLLRNMKNPEWEPTAQPLRRLAREHVVEETSAETRTDLWLGEWFGRFPPQEVDETQARDALRSGAILLDGVTWLMLEPLARFLRMQLGEEMKIAGVRKLMRRAGWAPSSLKLESGSARAWRKEE